MDDIAHVNRQPPTVHILGGDDGGNSPENAPIQVHSGSQRWLVADKGHFRCTGDIVP